ncbi:MAG: hypothetical protein QOF76_1653 [Solirubrobacteraceae bacterium]|jgi:DNA-binding NarL/FixJ family response regulator|nr:hypothetical protein [Solirubrobacteraceae bacterium]
MAATRILHCDDASGYRVLVREMLRPCPDLCIVETASDHADAVRKAAAVQPDVVLLDLDASRDEQVVSRLREVCSARLVVLSGNDDLPRDPLVMQADGFLSKAEPFGRIAEVVRDVSPNT